MKKAVTAARYNAGFAVLALAQVGVSMGLSTVLGALTGRVSTAGLPAAPPRPPWWTRWPACPPTTPPWPTSAGC